MAVSMKDLILVPGLITLAVTLLRLAGELLGGPASFFNPAAGGAGAIVGIVWLVPVFGIYFALKLAKAGERPAGALRAIGYTLLAFAVLPAIAFVATKLGVEQQSLGALGVFAVASIAGIAVAFRGWPALAKTLFAYGLAARIPVALVMLVAILGDWGTHYDVPPPGFPPGMNAFAKWVLIGLVPQLTFWVWFTMVFGALFGAIAAALAGRKPNVPAPA